MTQPDVYRRPCCDTVGAVDHADWCPEGPDVPVTQPQGRQLCVACRQPVDPDLAHPVKTNHGNGHGWRCDPCNRVADDWLYTDAASRVRQVGQQQ